MINKYINKLLVNFPTKTSKPIYTDLIIDGGLFNGSYLLGCLYFLKKMEKKKLMIIDKISVCSISSISILFYYIDCLDMWDEIYKKAIQHLNEKGNLNIVTDILNEIRPFIPSNFCSIINKKLYISYYHVNKGKKVVSTFKSIDYLFEIIRRSCFLPMIVDGNLLHKGKYFDGVNPYTLPSTPNKKRIYIELITLDKLKDIISIKNETTSLNRILIGILDIHLFLIKQKSTDMCSYFHDWSLMNLNSRKCCKKIFEIIVYYIIFIINMVYINIFRDMKITPINIFKNMYKLIHPHIIKYLCL